MTDQAHRTLRSFFFMVTIASVCYLVFRIVPKKESISNIIEHFRDTSHIVVVNPVPSETIVSKDTIYIPPNYDDLVLTFIEAVKQRDEINKYDSTVYITNDKDTTGVIPYKITTKGKLLDFSMSPVVTSIMKTEQRDMLYGVYGGMSTMVLDKGLYLSLEGSYQNKNGQIFTLGKGINSNLWSFGVKVPIIKKY